MKIPGGFYMKPYGIYIDNIVSFEDFFLVQGEKGKRSNVDEYTGKRKAARYSSQNVLSGLLVCAECSANYRRITRPSGEIVWRCANRVEHSKRICKHSPSLTEAQLKEDICRLLGVDSFNDLIVEECIEGVHVQESGTLEIDYKEQEFSQVMRG